jgi:phosphoribosylglycinamide formyltransferase-1
VQKIKESNPELIVLAGYMRILSDEFCHQFKGKILNIHPSLLPKYQGLNTYDRVLKSTDEYHGSTVHFVIPELDSGPIVLQYRTKIKPHDNPNSLAKRVQQGEYLMYPMAIKMFAEGALRMVDNQAILNGKPITKVRIIE